MQLWIDADACPVVDIAIRTALKHNVLVTLVCDDVLAQRDYQNVRLRKVLDPFILCIPLIFLWMDAAKNAKRHSDHLLQESVYKKYDSAFFSICLSGYGEFIQTAAKKYAVIDTFRRIPIHTSPRGWCSAQRIPNLHDCRGQSYLNSQVPSASRDG